MQRITARSGGAVTRTRATACLLLALLAALAGTTTASAGSEPWTIILPAPLGFVENDSIFHGTDRHYTNGLYASATSAEKTGTDCPWCDGLASLMLPVTDEQPKYHVGFFAGQSMFTPEKLNISPPNPRDRPYAGWLYVGARLYREANASVLDKLELDAGAVGPSSGADAVQRWWHAWGLFGGVPPLGWHAQIKDEPGLVLSEQRVWRLDLVQSARAPGGLSVDLLPELTASAGNVLTYAGAGFTFRVGSDLNADWGPPRIEPARAGSDFVHFHDLHGVGAYLFAGFEERAILRNIFLDGNSFQHSANIAKEPIVADLDLGGEILSRWGRITVSYTLRTHEFKTQHNDDKFYSLSFSFPSFC